MSSQGTAADITPQDASDILHKLITESIKVQAVFVSGAGAKLRALVAGFVKPRPDGMIWVVGGEGIGAPNIFFDPTVAVSRKYGDNRAFPGEALGSDAPSFSSALGFVFADGSHLSLFIFAE